MILTILGNSKSTLSGTTIAHLPFTLRMVFTCCKKFNCLFDVVAQKSSCSYDKVSRSAFPASENIMVLDFFPNGGFV